MSITSTSQKNVKSYIRRLTPQDEAKFIELLTAVYGHSYSYQNLYDKGQFSSLLQNDKLISYGEFTEDQRLISHSGFLIKEQDSDYVESGISFRLPHTNLAANASETLQEWQNAFLLLSEKYSFIHQQCTTWHPLAQRYANRYMRARACGVIMNYVENETLQGIETTSKHMHSLIMTTVLNPLVSPVKTVYIPQAILSWIQDAYSRLELPVQVKPCEQSAILYSSFYLQLIEDNPAIQLQRRRIIFSPESKQEFHGIHCSSSKTDLIHVSMNSAGCIASVYPLLIQAGYFPCGIRPHLYQDDELIFQRIKPYQHQLKEWLLNMKIACKSTKLWLEQWYILTQQIL
jgi:hypothetical protein